jgi:HSP20 family molecular chaperone IbpA
MEKMRREMDRAFEDAFREFRESPDHQGFFDEPRFGSSIDLKEEGENYVVRAYLPNRDMQNINVTVEGRNLRIEAKEQELTKKAGAAGASHSTRTAAYSQFLTLPGPVQGDQMKVDKKDGMLVVILPKQK